MLMFECPAIRARVHTSQPLSPSRVRNVCRIEDRFHFLFSHDFRTTGRALNDNFPVV